MNTQFIDYEYIITYDGIHSCIKNLNNKKDKNK